MQTHTYCLYARKSTESEERQVMSIDSQMKEMMDTAKREGLDIVAVKKESHSAKEQGKRKVFNEMLTDIQEGKYNSILTWAPDRLARNAGDLGKLVDLMDREKLVEIHTHSQTFTNNPNEKFLLMILGSQAKLENDNRSINIKRGMKARAEKGLATSIPTGYKRNPNRDDIQHMVPDERTADMVKEIYQLYIQGWSMRQIQSKMKVNGYKTETGKVIAIGTMNRVLTNPTYYGVVEFPIRSNNYIKGVHEPLIDKETFDRAQKARNKRGNYTRPKEKPKLALTGLIRCSMCGSQVTGYIQPKTVNGETKKYVYYRCCKYKDKYCCNQQTSELQLLQQLKEILNEIDIQKILDIEAIQQDIQAIERYSAIKGESLAIQEKNIRDYINHILDKGSDEEKRIIIQSLADQFTYLNKKLIARVV